MYLSGVSVPNHITNILDVYGSIKEVNAFRRKVYSLKEEEGKKKPFFDFNATVPMPEEVRNTTSPNNDKELAERLTKTYGASDWYDWAHKNWGTKWGAYDACKPEKLPDGSLRFQFDTAWNIGIPWLTATSKQFPGLTLTTYWHDEGGGSGVTTIEDGEILHDGMDDDEWREKFDYVFRDAMKEIKDLPYSEFRKKYIINFNKQGLYYEKVERSVLDRAKDEDLPLLIDAFEYDDVIDMLQERMKRVAAY